MKPKIQTIGLAILAAVVLVACDNRANIEAEVGVEAEVEAELEAEVSASVDGYKVLLGRNTSNKIDLSDKEHDNAVYAVFQTKKPPNPEWGIFFMQIQGTFPFLPFACGGGAWDPTSQSHSCSVESSVGGVQLKETVTIGRLTGNFCKNLRDEHNPKASPHPDNPIIVSSECPVGAGLCTCYEVLHECRLNDLAQYDESVCPDFAAIFSGGASTAGDDGTGFAPPGHGAGSGRR